mgnify:CR=1 FL=1
MSLPLTRRIARAALVAAAGAAPVVLGAAGTAQAVELPKTANLDALSSLDNGALSTPQQTLSRAAELALGSSGREAVDNAVPAAAATVRATGDTLLPTAERTLRSTDGRAAGLVARVAEQTLGDQLPTESLVSDKVRVSGLPTDQLPGAQLLG